MKSGETTKRQTKQTKPPDAAVIAWVAQQCREDAREPGWMTIQEIVAATGAPQSSVFSQLRRGVREGRVKCKTVRIVTGSGKCQQTKVYFMDGAKR
jgi:hypothetical protein